MLYRSLGKSGLKVSLIGLGTNRFGDKVDLETTRSILDAAFDQGINFIDTADVYTKGNSETFIGQALQGRRQKAVLATKVFHPMGEGPNERGASRLHIMQGVEASLRRLETDVIDLYQIHRWDAAVPLEETLRALDDLLSAGKIRYIGASNFAAWQLARANTLAEMRGWQAFVSVQPHYHMLEREVEKELVPACEYLGVGILPYFPLAGGFLTGKYQEGAPAPAGSRGETSQYVQKYMISANFERLRKLTAYAEERDHSMLELAHAWLAACPQVASIISGATRVEQVLANAAAGDWALTPAEKQEVDALLA